MKVALLLASRPEVGGGFQYSRCVLKSLRMEPARGAGVRLQVITLNPGWVPLATEEGVDSVVVNVPRPVRYLRRICERNRWHALWRRARHSLSPLSRAIQRTGADVLISACQAFLTMDSPIPAIAPLHDLMYVYESRWYICESPSPRVGRAKTRSRLSADQGAIDSSAGILVDSEVGRRHVVETFGADPRQIHVLPYCTHRAMTGGPATARKPAVPVPDRYLFYPAQFWRHKNHIALLKAVRRLQDQGVQVSCVFCGSEKTAASEVRVEAERLGIAERVVMLGFVDDEELVWLYQNAVALVMPTYFGPTNIPPLEAMELGCPVAVSRIYAMEEQLGDAALYFNPDSVEQIADSINTLWTREDVRQSLIIKGLERSQRYGLRCFASRLWEIVETVNTARPSLERVAT